MILVIIWRSHVLSEKNDEYIYLETHKQETLYYGKEIDTYSWAYIFLEKGAGDNTGKAEDQQEDRDSYDQTGNREEDWWGYHQETLWEVDGGEGCCDAV